MAQTMTGETIGQKPYLDTTERISIAQCLNLAIEVLGQDFGDASAKDMTKRFYKIKQELEEEFLKNGHKFD